MKKIFFILIYISLITPSIRLQGQKINQINDISIINNLDSLEKQYLDSSVLTNTTNILTLEYNRLIQHSYNLGKDIKKINKIETRTRCELYLYQYIKSCTIYSQSNGSIFNAFDLAQSALQGFENLNDSSGIIITNCLLHSLSIRLAQLEKIKSNQESLLNIDSNTYLYLTSASNHLSPTTQAIIKLRYFYSVQLNLYYAHLNNSGLDSIKNISNKICNSFKPKTIPENILILYIRQNAANALYFQDSIRECLDIHLSFLPELKSSFTSFKQNLYHNISNEYYALGIIDSFLHFGDLYLQEHRKHNNYDKLTSATFKKFYSDYYNLTGNKKLAKDYLIQYYEEKVDILKNSMQQNESWFAYKKKLIEVKNKKELLQTENELNKIIIYSIVFLLLTLTVAFLYINKVRKKLKLTLLENNKLILERENTFAVVAHDLKSQVSHYGLLSNALNTSIQTNSLASLKKTSNLLELSSKQINLMLENLLTWSNSSLRKYTTSYQNFNLIKLQQEQIKLFTPIAKLRNLEIKYPEPKVNNENIYSDKYLVTLLFRNLLDNAIKYSTEHKQIIISNVFYESYVMLKFSNRSMLANQDLNNINSILLSGQRTKAINPSSGFGLALVNNIINKLDGETNVHYEEEILTIVIKLKI